MTTTNFYDIGICGQLWNKKEDLKRYSISLQETDAKTNFEFFVFVDQGDKNNPPFLKELFNYLENRNNFACPEHKEQLIKNWLGNKDSDLVTPLNWLKIAIDKYPYRLFVITDREKCFEEINNEFVKRRICFIKKREIEKVLKQLEEKKDINLLEVEYSYNEEKINYGVALEQFKLWLYYKWIEFLLKMKNVDDILLSVRLKESKDNNRTTCSEAVTLPTKLSALVRDISKEIRDCSIMGNKIKLRYYTEECDNNIISYRRHRDYLTKVANINNLNEIEITQPEKFFYSEYLTGQLDYFICLTSISQLDAKGLEILFLMIENALLTSIIVDERVLRYWKKLNEIRSLFVIGKRILPSIWEEQKRYNQPEVSNEKAFIFSKSGDIIWPNSESNNNYSKLKNIKYISTPDILIIHQGLLDKDEELNGDKIKITSLLLEIKEKIPYIIITSGRGVPSNLPFGCKFIPYSLIEYYMLREFPNKLFLIKNLMEL